MKNHNLFQSFNHAIRRLSYVLKTQRNMRIHLLLGAAVLIGSFLLRLTSLEFIILCCTVTSVLVAEMINTYAELTIDLIVKNTYHPLVKAIKDIAAGVGLWRYLPKFLCSKNFFMPETLSEMPA